MKETVCHKCRILLCFLGAAFLLLDQTNAAEDVWSLFRFFEGKWEGTGAGEPGNSTVHREYQFVLDGGFLLVKNRSTYLPQEKSPKGEVHEDWGVFSRDRLRKLFVLRQFNVEGFVNQYTIDTLRLDSATLVFTTEAIENLRPGWRARETYKLLHEDEFIETFELAGPGKQFEVYSETHLQRVKE